MKRTGDFINMESFQDIRVHWGPCMELGHEFHRLESFYGNDIKSFREMCDRAFEERNSKTK